MHLLHCLDFYFLDFWMNGHVQHDPSLWPSVFWVREGSLFFLTNTTIRKLPRAWPDLSLPCSFKYSNHQLSSRRVRQSVPVRMGRRNSQDGEGWKFVTSGTRRNIPASPQDLQFQNRFSALIANKSLGALLKQAPKPAKPGPSDSNGRLPAVKGPHLPTSPAI